jgi:hypothetical protein
MHVRSAVTGMEIIDWNHNPIPTDKDGQCSNQKANDIGNDQKSSKLHSYKFTIDAAVKFECNPFSLLRYTNGLVCR